MEQFELERDDDRPLRFTGELLAEASSKRHEGPASNRWQELRLYRSAAGKLIAQRIGRTIWVNERNRYEAAICADEQAVVEYFGLGDTAKLLYHPAGIDVAEQID